MQRMWETGLFSKVCTMRKILVVLVLALSFSFIPSFAVHADTVNIRFVMDTMNPSRDAAIVSQGSYAFRGTNQIVFRVAGKTCTFVGSAQAIGPIGCNYWLTANVSTGYLSDPRAENNPGCTSAQNMLANCR